MPHIHIKTHIKAPIERVFDLSRSIDLHKISTAKSNEEAIAGKISGLIQMNESVTWRAKHFGITQELTSKITEYNRPFSFTDEMQKGAFKSFKHEHIFSESEGTALMVDVFEYKSPLGLLGKLADILFLKKYMKKFLLERNQVIKEFAESENWKEVLK
ncbi:cell division protein [Brumimicrobium glaciale]|uniref:Cell division protein n=1 Tax=Brumimicrobium glaciale TaxID=200475 RepID=A0A4Q4KJY8_9FLAO|nr:SRPBCC family protein [Brumimicrobium glaciale]RYM32119.1 cell division protein [Brumimicrobium glaciale]